MSRARNTSTPRGPATRRRRSGAAWLAVAWLAISVVGCGQKRSVGPAASTGELPDQEVSDFVLTETEQATPVWKLFARYAATYNARNLVVARGVRVDFFDEHGVQSSELTAREGEIQQQTRNMVARGDVVLQTTEGTRMSTQEIRFLNKEQKIVSPIEQQVRVERRGDVLTGYGFESDPDLRHFEFKRRVQAVVKTQSGGGILERSGDRR
jgi:LPS export ABC transporter protein LptC